jgi:hypothetical protein
MDLLGFRLELTFMQETKSPVVSNFSSPTVGTNMGMRNSWKKIASTQNQQYGS